MNWFKYLLILLLTIPVFATEISTLSQGLIGHWTLTQSAEIPAPTYTSDFSADADSWAATNGTIAGNIDSISDGTTSYDNVLRFYADGTAGNHLVSQTILTVGQYYYLDCWVYVPTAQTHVDGFQIRDAADNVIYSGNGESGTWVNVKTNFTPTNTALIFYQVNGAIRSFTGANNIADDLMYVYDIKLRAISTMDISGNSNHGSMYYTEYDTSRVGGLNQCVLFYSSDTYIDSGIASDNAEMKSDVSVSWWSKLDSPGEAGTGRILINGTFDIYTDLDTLKISRDGSTYAESAAVVDTSGIWQHWIVTSTDAGVTNIYCNGVLTGSADQSAGTPVNGSTNLIVGNKSDKSATVDGNLDDLRIQRRVLTTTEIDELYRKVPE